MMHRGAAVLALMITAGFGCAGNTGPSALDPIDLTGFTEIDVDNGTPSSIRVYALEAGGETFLGRVAPLTETSVRIAQVESAMIRLVAKPSVITRVGEQHVSEPILITPGQRVTWRLHASPGVAHLPRISTVHVLACSDGRDC
jgi:hypothetical protein